MINFKEDEYLSKLNHSCAHLLAQAVKRLYPQAKFWVGPVIEGGFYYDIDLGEEVISEGDLEKIEEEMHRCAKEESPIIRKELSREEAIKMFKNDSYKEDLISRMPEGEVISIYSQNDFTDLCRGPHVDNTKELKYFKLIKTSGAYWKGDSHNKMLQRIYGVCFKSDKQMKEHLKFLEEAKKRDHRKIGQELNIFMISDYGRGFPIWLPNGTIMLKELEDYWYEVHQRAGYEMLRTPTILSKELWVKSGHWDNYKENMYTTMIDGEEYAIKPMNCPGGMLAYNNTIHSYRELPLRFGEWGHVHRHEASGALSGLFRVRAFTQDDAHIFLRYDQIEEEVLNILSIVDEMYKTFGFDYKIYFSTRPEKKFIGTIEDWDDAERRLENGLKKANKPYKINKGDGAFYGPKIDICILDSLGREWQCSTIQLDMQLPERFDVNYIDENGKKVRPAILHRTIYGSFERFMGILIEHYAGAFPIWLAPIQIAVLPINSELHSEYALSIYKSLKDKGVRVILDNTPNKFNYRLRDTQMKKIPVTLIVGDSEIENKEVSFRLFGEKKTTTLSKDAFLDYVLKHLHERD